ncbi:MAG: hypothetical protein ACP5J4_01480 [Anaerolineae bacterium]
MEPDEEAVADEDRDKAQGGWEGQPLGRGASVFARRVGIVSRTFPDSPAPQNSAQNVARR